MNKNAVEEQREALKSLFEANLKDLAYYGWSILKTQGYKLSREEMGDILNETYLKAYHLLADERYAEVRNMNGWVRRVLHFEVLTYLKKRRPFADLDDIINQHKVIDALTYTIDNEVAAGLTLENIMEGLTEEESNILKHTIDGYSSKEIGEKLGVTADAVRQTRSRTLKDLKKKLKV